MRAPGFVRRQVLHFECAIEDAVRKFSGGLGARARVLDAGAGESRHAKWFTRQRYFAVDLATGDAAWDYSRLEAICDLAALPFADASFDAAINIVTLEHVREPAAALREIARVLKPGAALLLITPFEWEEHQQPHDYFRYTRYGLDYLLGNAGFERAEIRPVGGYFRLLSRRLMNGIRFCTRGRRWVLFPLAAMVFGPPALLLPVLDGLDGKKAFTLGYVTVARRLRV